ncbi:MAG: hypothetical protein JJU00_06370 [Opitutales bacterium]|nr:hypothetical protein [Opitutales bacterium]
MPTRSYALPLYSLVDKAKVDPRSPQLQELAERLGGYLAASLGIDSLHTRVELANDEPILVLHGVDAKALPKLFALADVQRTQLHEYSRDGDDQFTLRPLAVKPDGD